MYKEVIIILIIILLIVVGNFSIQKFLENSSSELVGRLEEVYYKLQKSENDLGKENEIEKTSKELEEKWMETQKIWSLIVVHSELDMIELAFSDMKTAIENNNLDDSYIKIKELNFLLSHIPERDAFKIKNIF